MDFIDTFISLDDDDSLQLILDKQFSPKQYLGLLYYSIIHFKYKVTRYLLKNTNADPSVDPDIILLACKSSPLEIVRLLLDWRGPNGEFVNPSIHGNDCLVKACEKENIELLKILLEWRGPNGEFVDPTIKSNYVLLYVCQFKRNEIATEITRLLISWHGPNGEFVDITLKDNKLLMVALDNGFINLINLLLSWRGPNSEYTDPTVQNNDALLGACRWRRVEVVRLLLEWRGPNGEFVDPTSQNNTSIVNATMENSIEGHEITLLLLEWRGPNKSVNPSVKDIVIINACEFGWSDVVRLLLADIRIDPSIKDNMPFINLCDQPSNIWDRNERHSEVVRQLLNDRRVNPRAKNELALIHALRHRNIPLLQLLLDWVGPNGERFNIGILTAPAPDKGLHLYREIFNIAQRNVRFIHSLLVNSIFTVNFVLFHLLLNERGIPTYIDDAQLDSDEIMQFLYQRLKHSAFYKKPNKLKINFKPSPKEVKPDPIRNRRFALETEILRINPRTRLDFIYILLEEIDGVRIVELKPLIETIGLDVEDEDEMERIRQRLDDIHEFKLKKQFEDALMNADAHNSFRINMFQGLRKLKASKLKASKLKASKLKTSKLKTSKLKSSKLKSRKSK